MKIYRLLYLIYMIFTGSFIRFTWYLQAPLFDLHENLQAPLFDLQAPLFDLHGIYRLLYSIYMKIYRLLNLIYMKIYRLLYSIYMVYTGSFIRFT